MKNYIIKTLAYNKQVRILFVDNTNMVKEICDNKSMNKLLKTVLGKTVSIASLISGTLKGNQRVSIKVNASNRNYKRQKTTLEQFINSIELIKSQKECFTQEQINRMKKHYDKLNNDKANGLASSWSQLNSLLQSEMDKGTAVDNPRVIELAKKWQEGMNFQNGFLLQITK